MDNFTVYSSPDFHNLRNNKLFESFYPLQMINENNLHFLREVLTDMNRKHDLLSKLSQTNVIYRYLIMTAEI